MTDLDNILNAERENERDRPKDSLSLLCTVIAAQHRELVALREEVDLHARQLDRLQERNPW